MIGEDDKIHLMVVESHGTLTFTYNLFAERIGTTIGISRFGAINPTPSFIA